MKPSLKTMFGKTVKPLRTAATKVGGFFRRHWMPLAAVPVVLVAVAAVAWVIVPAPKAFGAVQGHTVEIYRNAQMRIVFDQRMDHASVEKAFAIKPAVDGTFGWRDNELTFTPKKDLEKGMSYEVIVGDGAKNTWQKPLAETFRQTFAVLDYPEVAVAAPVDGSVIMQDQVLTVLFDHPIRNLTEETNAPEMLKIEPAVVGEYHWLGTSGFEFVPKDGWPAATAFTVTVPKGTKTADGGSTVMDFTWKFNTANLTVYSAYEQDNHNPKFPVRLEFNYPVNPDAVRKAITIRENADPKQLKTSPAIATDVFEFGTLKDQPGVVTVMRRGDYQLGMRYLFALPAGFTADVGPLGLRSDWSDEITMDEKGFRFVSSDPSGMKDVYESVELIFNNPVSADTSEKNIRVSPAIEDLSLNSYDAHQVYVYGRWKPSTTYTITMGRGLKDIHGQALESEQTVTITTRPYEPSAQLAGYSIHGVLAAHLPRLYQLRTMNLTQTITADICSGTFEEFLANKDFGCTVKGQKTYDPNGTLNQYKIIDVDLDTVAGTKLANGAYRLDLTIPGLPHYSQPKQTRTLLVTDTALTVKRDNTGKVLVWATDHQTGQPVADLDVEVWKGYEPYGNTSDPTKAASGKTDKDGIAVLQIGAGDPQSPLAVRATDKTRFGFVATNWDDGISPWNFGLDMQVRTSPSRHIGYVYTDRRIYRPDQLVYFKGVVRLDTDAKLTLPTMKDVAIVIEDSQGKEISNQTLPVSAYGTFNGQLQLDSSMPLGTYSVYASIAGDAGEERGVAGSFDVREYRRPDFKVETASPAGTLTSGQKIEIPVHAEYYHGVALSGAKVSYSISRTKLYFQPMQGEWYSYSDDDSMFDCWWYCRTQGDYEDVLSGEATLDDNGNATITLPANLTDYKSSATYTVNVTVTDVNRRSVSNSSEFAVHKGEFYIGIRPDYTGGWGSANADFDLVSITPDGIAKPGTSMTVKLSKRTWANSKKTNADGSTSWEWQKTDTYLQTQTVTTDASGKAHVSFTPPGNGEFVAVAESRDSRGNLIAASADRYIYRNEISGIRITDDHQMTILQEKASYDTGDTASLAVQTPYRETKALVTVERDTIRSWRVVTLGSAARTVDVPITDDMTPNVYVSVQTVQGGGATGVPEFRLGYADLQVNTTKKMLDLSVTADRATYKPGDKVTLTVRALKSDGMPADAEVSLAAVDERVIALLGPVDKNILGKFWFPRTIGVTTAQSLTMLVKKVFFATEGGAGGKGGEENVPAIRGNFKDTAYWNATVQTGADGKATVSFDLPDNLTTWNILAIGATKDTVVGSGETSIMTRRDLMAEPLLPRLVRHEDTVTLGATVFNTTNAAVNAQVTMTADGLVLTDPAPKNITVAPNARTAVYWTARVPKAGTDALITILAKGGGYEDGFKVSIPILPFSVPESVSASGILEKNVTETLEIPDGIMKDQGDVRVSVQPNIGNGLQNGMDYLVGYPYGCSEQKTSALLGNLMYEELVKLKVTKENPAKLEESKKNIEEAIKLIVPTQNQDGGFRYWSDSDKSYPHLTAYVLWGLTQAQKAGFAVDQGVMDRADEYLRNSLGASWDSNQYFWDNEKAQVLFTLSERNTDGLAGYAATLYERRDKLSNFAKTFLAMAYGNIEKGTSSARAARLLGDLKNEVVYLNPSTAYVKEGSGYEWYMSTELRTTSLYLQALLKIDPKNEDVERTVRYLVQARKDGYWETTQNTSMALLGLVEYVRANPIDERAAAVQVFLDNAPTDLLKFPQGDVSGQATKIFPLYDLTPKGMTHQIGLEKDTATRWFYDITMKTYKEIADIQPFDNGFTVLSDVFAIDDKKSEHPLSEVNQGDMVRVRLKLLVPKKHEYVALESHLPAGLEAVDFTLKTSPQQLAGETKQCSPTWWGGQRCMEDWELNWWWENVWKHIEFRDDRVFLFSESLDPGVYEYEYVAQAVTPGTFRVPPARVYEFYNPMANAHNEGKIFTVKAK